MSETAVATVVFPANANFIDDFLSSLCRQTQDDFEVFILNDGFEEFSFFVEKYSSLKITEHKYSNTPSKIRQKIIDLLYDSEYENIIFCDSDDYLADNRIEKSVFYLKKYPIIFNDLTSFSENTVLEKNIWASRFVKNKTINKQFLINKNVLGLGNTAIRKDVLKKIELDSNLLAVDWAIFYTLIEEYEAFFVEETQTFYRQHNLNTVGLNTISLQRVQAAIDVKKRHYNFIKKKDLYNKMILLEELNPKSVIEKKINSFQRELNKNFFWWEETIILEK